MDHIFKHPWVKQTLDQRRDQLEMEKYLDESDRQLILKKQTFKRQLTQVDDFEEQNSIVTEDDEEYDVVDEPSMEYIKLEQVKTINTTMKQPLKPML